LSTGGASLLAVSKKLGEAQCGDTVNPWGSPHCVMDCEEEKEEKEEWEIEEEEEEKREEEEEEEEESVLRKKEIKRQRRRRCIVRKREEKKSLQQNPQPGGPRSLAASILNKGIINLAGAELSAKERDVLAAGIRFVPSGRGKWSDVVPKLSRLKRKMKLAVCAKLWGHSEQKGQAAEAFQALGPTGGLAFVSPVVAPPSDFVIEEYKPWKNNDPRIAREKREVLQLLPILEEEVFKRWNLYRKPSNFIREEHVALRKMKENHPDLVFVPADKDRAFVVLTKEMYRDFAMRHLGDKETYRHLGTLPSFEDTDVIQGKYRWPETPKIRMILNSFFARARFAMRGWDADDGRLHKQEIKFVHQWISDPVQKKAGVMFNIPKFRLLIKTHKKVLAGRPICGATNWITTPISKFLSKKLRPLLEKFAPYYSRDSKSVISELEETRKEGGVTSDSYFVCTADVTAMYPNIPLEWGLKAVEDFLLEIGVDAGLCTLLVALVRLVLEHNLMIFGDNIYLQIKGTAMGTNFAPEYAGIVYWKIEKSTLSYSTMLHPTAESYIPVQLGILSAVLQTKSTSMCFYRRFVDDLFAIVRRKWRSVEEVVEQRRSKEEEKKECEQLASELFSDFNSGGVLVVDSFEVGRSIPFLDALVSLTEDGLKISPYYKPTSTFLYIPPFSLHNSAVMTSWTVNETRRLLRLSTEEGDYWKAVKFLLWCLKRRGYPPSLRMGVVKKMWDHSKRGQTLNQEPVNPKPRTINPKPRVEAIPAPLSFPMVLPKCQQSMGLFPRRVFELARMKLGPLSPMWQSASLFGAWSRLPNLSESLRVSTKEIEKEGGKEKEEEEERKDEGCESKKRRRDEESGEGEGVDKRRKVD
jgi:hypothetical protein